VQERGEGVQDSAVEAGAGDGGGGAGKCSRGWHEEGGKGCRIAQ